MIVFLVAALTPSHRCAQVQNSDQLYQALKRLGVATSLVVYPDSGHWVGAPSEEADAYQRWLDWFARFNP